MILSSEYSFSGNSIQELSASSKDDLFYECEENTMRKFFTVMIKSLPFSHKKRKTVTIPFVVVVVVVIVDVVADVVDVVVVTSSKEKHISPSY